MDCKELRGSIDNGCSTTLQVRSSNYEIGLKESNSREWIKTHNRLWKLRQKETEEIRFKRLDELDY